MAKIKVFEAAKEGFRLIRREPKAVLVWSLVSYLLMGAPIMLMMSRMARAVMQADSSASGQAPDGFMLTVALTPLIWLGMIVGYGLVGGAVLRAVLKPDEDRRYFLRLSRAEAWMMLSAVVGAVMAYIAFFVVLMALLMLVIGPLIFFLARTSEVGASGLVFMLAPLVVLACVYPFGLYLALRFCMGPIMSFDERQFRLFESWTLTRGEGWRLVGLGLLLTLFVLVFDLLIFAFMAGLGGPNILAMFGDPAEAMAMSDKMWAFYASPKLWLFSAVGAIFAGPGMAIMIAPWARAYAMLRAARPNPA